MLITMSLISHTFIFSSPGKPREFLTQELASLLAGTAPFARPRSTESPLRVLHGVINLACRRPWLEVVLHRQFTLDDSGYLIQQPGAVPLLLTGLNEAQGKSLQVVKLAQQVSAAGRPWVVQSMEDALSEEFLLLNHHRAVPFARAVSAQQG
jgi:hypothetical protein